MGKGFGSKKIEEILEREKQIMQENAPRVVVTGPTGSGKSSLINQFFGLQLAHTGIGRPVTQDFREFPATDARPLTLYDSQGFERDDHELLQRTRAWVADMQAREAVPERLHLLWYVVDCGSARWTGADTRYVSEIFGAVPSVIILHKCDLLPRAERAAFRARVLRAAGGAALGAVFVASAPRAPPDCCGSCGSAALRLRPRGGNGGNDAFDCLCRDCGARAGALGHDTLLSLTLRHLPDALKGSFVASLEGQARARCGEAARQIVRSRKRGFAVGLLPVPIVDSLLLNTVQLEMLVRMGLVWGVPAEVLAALAGAQFVAMYLVGNPATYLKYVPVVGTAAGMSACPPFYAALTTIVGVMWGAVMKDLAKWGRELGDKVGKDRRVVTSYVAFVARKKLLKRVLGAIKDDRKLTRRRIEKLVLEIQVPYRGGLTFDEVKAKMLRAYEGNSVASANSSSSLTEETEPGSKPESESSESERED